jgi:hypothetical protein
VVLAADASAIRKPAWRKLGADRALEICAGGGEAVAAPASDEVRARPAALEVGMGTGFRVWPPLGAAAGTAPP